MVVLDAFRNEAKPLGLEVSWTKTKIQDFGDILGEPVQSVRACGVRPGSQQMDWPGSRGLELSRQEYLEVTVPVQKDQADNARFAIR